MEAGFLQSIECPECGAIVGDQRTSGHLRWMFCGHCEASWRPTRAIPGPEGTIVAEVPELDLVA